MLIGVLVKLTHTEECQYDLAIACKNMPLICVRCQGRAALDWYKSPRLDVPAQAGFRFMKSIHIFSLTLHVISFFKHYWKEVSSEG